VFELALQTSLSSLQKALPYIGLEHVVEEGKIHAATLIPLSAAVVVVLYASKQLVAVRSQQHGTCPPSLLMAGYML
jgi:hypothetical protein